MNEKLAYIGLQFHCITIANKYGRTTQGLWWPTPCWEYFVSQRMQSKNAPDGASEKSITRCRQNNAKRAILAVIAISNVCHNLMKSGIGGEMDLKTWNIGYHRLKYTPEATK